MSAGIALGFRSRAEASAASPHVARSERRRIDQMRAVAIVRVAWLQILRAMAAARGPVLSSTT